MRSTRIRDIAASVLPILAVGLAACVAMTTSSSAETRKKAKWARVPQEVVERFDGLIATGMEVELKGWSLQRLFHDMDFDGYQAKHPNVVKRVPAEMVDHYLENPANFDKLPKETRDRLTAGLKHYQGAKIEASKPKVPDPTALGAGQTRTAGGLIVPSAPRAGGGIVSAPVAPPARPTRPESGGLILPGASRPKDLPAAIGGTSMARDGELLVPDNSLVQKDWDEIRKRWKEEIPIDERRSMLRLGSLDRSDLEKLMLPKDQAPIIVAKELELKPDLPDPVKRAYQGLEWDKDGGAIEFRHKAPLSDPNAYLDQLEAFAERAGIEERLRKPTQGMLESYHNHTSVKGAGDATSRMRADNMRRFLDALDQDYLGVLDYAIVSFNDIDTKGLGRAVAGNRYESRFHLSDPGTELLNSILTLGDDDYAIDRLAIALDTRLDAGLLKIADGKSHAKLGLLLRELVTLEPYLPKTQIYVEKLTRALPATLAGVEGPWRREIIKVWIRNGAHPKIAKGIAAGMDDLARGGMLDEFLDILFHERGVSGVSSMSSIEPIIVRALELSGPASRELILRQLRVSRRSWDQPLWREILVLHGGAKGKLRLDIEDLMLSQSHWPDFAISAGLQSDNPELALQYLRNHPDQTDRHVDDLKRVFAEKRKAGIRDKELEKWVIHFEDHGSCIQKGLSGIMPRR